MLQRVSNTVPAVTIATSVASSQELFFGNYGGGMIHIPTGSSITTLTWYVADKPGGTYLAAYDEAGTQLQQTVGDGKAYAIPLGLFGCAAVKVVGDAGGTAAITLKS